MLVSELSAWEADRMPNRSMVPLVTGDWSAVGGRGGRSGSGRRVG